MSGDSNWQDLLRRRFMQYGGAAALGALGATPAVATDDGVPADSNGVTDQEGQEAPEPTERITGAQRVSPRDFYDDENYAITHMHRRKEAIRQVLQDPEANSVASDWIAHFVGYEPLSNYLDAISLQGPTDYTIEGGLEEGSFTITANDRQTIYGLVDRRQNDLVALQINDPIDVTWEENYTESQVRRGEVLLERDEVQDYLENRDWWAMYKVTEIITAYQDFPHGDASVAAFNAVGDDGLSIVSGYLDVSGSEPQFLNVEFIDDFTRYPVPQMARDIGPNGETVLGEVPNVPVEKRPTKTANDGYHRYESLPDQQFEQDNWEIQWEPPETEGVTLRANYNGKPVFQAMNAMATPTGYGLPPRNGRNTREWFFPDDEPVFNGRLLYWDIHSIPFGGPGQLAKVDYPERRGHPSGFQFRTHYHTGAQGRESIDFHSGAQFGPYNYNISYEFFEDGRMIPIWRRHGPGYVMSALRMHGEPESWEGEEIVTQQYMHQTAIDVTPGTRQGVDVMRFDGNEWSEAQEEFYKEGRAGHKVRFENPDGPEYIDIPLADDMEIVVVKRLFNEMGPSDMMATRAVDVEEERAFYHPAQYVDGDDIVDERVIAWVIVEGSTDEVPHPSAVSGYTATAELQLHNF